MKRLIITILLWVAAVALFLFFINMLFTIPAPTKWLVARWSAGDQLSFFGTVILGFITVWQTREANAVSKRLADLELQRQTPKVHIGAISEEFLSEYHLPEAMRVNVGNTDTYAIIDSNFQIHEQNGEVLFFSIRNISSVDICSLCVDFIAETAVFDGEKYVDVQKHDVSACVFLNELPQSKAIPLILILPDDIFIRVCQNALQELPQGENAHIRLTLSFVMLSTAGGRYEEKVELHIANAYQPGIKSPIILNQTVYPITKIE